MLPDRSKPTATETQEIQAVASSPSGGSPLERQGEVAELLRDAQGLHSRFSEMTSRGCSTQDAQLFYFSLAPNKNVCFLLSFSETVCPNFPTTALFFSPPVRDRPLRNQPTSMERVMASVNS